MGPLCDAGCRVEFEATTVRALFEDKTVLQGRRAPPGLWIFHLPSPEMSGPSPPISNVSQVNSALGAPKAAELVARSHATLFSPALETLEQAVRLGYARNFPGLTTQTLRRHPPRSIAAAKGHMGQARKNLRSTRLKPSDIPLPDTVDVFPPQESPTDTCYLVTVALPSAPAGRRYADQTGKFPVTSGSGNNYALVACHYDCNVILAEPIRNRKGPTIAQARKVTLQRLRRAGVACSFVMLDNECSHALQEFFHDETIKFQKTPAGAHRRNSAERAIRTFKSHFIAGLRAAHSSFPLCLWDKLLTQAELTLNLLRGSRVNPKLSAWEQMHGIFDYNAAPLGPPGTRVLARDKPHQRGTWAPHGQDAYCIGPALDHYRCCQAWTWGSREERVTDTLTWFPEAVAMPTPSSLDLIAAGLQDIATALTDPQPASPLNPLASQQVKSLRDLIAALNGVLPVDDSAQDDPSRLRVGPQADQDKPDTTSVPKKPTILNTDETVTPVPAPPLTCAEVARSSRRRKKPAPAPTAPPATEQEPPVTDVPPAVRRSRRRRKPKTAFQVERADSPPVEPLPSPPSSQATDSNVEVSDDVFWALHSTAINPDTQLVAECKELSASSDGEHWTQSSVEELGRLAQGLGPGSDAPTGANTIFFIHPSQVPAGRRATYLRIVRADRPEKPQPRRARHATGGDRVDRPGSASTKTADLTTVKVLLNSVISTEDARFMTLGLKDFFLGAPLPDERRERARVPVSVIPDFIMKLCNLDAIAVNGRVHAEVRRGVRGLPQAAVIANKQLQEKLGPHGRAPARVTPGLWKHNALDVALALVVDDFGVKLTNRTQAEHLITSLTSEGYKLSQERGGGRCCGLTLKWDCKNRACNVSMPGYVERALQRLQRQEPTAPENSPRKWSAPKRGAKARRAESDDATPTLDASAKKRVQEIIGAFLLYARAVDNAMLKALGALPPRQASPAEAAAGSVAQLLNCASTHPSAELHCVASDVILWIDSDASYLSESKARPARGGCHFLSATQPTRPSHLCHSALSLLQARRRARCAPFCEKLCLLPLKPKSAGCSAAAKTLAPLAPALEELGRAQPPAPLKTGSAAAGGVANDAVKQKRSKAIDARCCWARDRARQGQLRACWRSSGENMFSGIMTRFAFILHLDFGTRKRA